MSQTEITNIIYDAPSSTADDSDVIEQVKLDTRNETLIERDKFHLQTLERFREEVRLGLAMRKEWVAEFEGKLAGLDELLERLKGGDFHEL